jgi:hypothetical protein
VPWENDKPTIVALREIAAGLIGPAILEETVHSVFEEDDEEEAVASTAAEDVASPQATAADSADEAPPATES